MRSVSTHAGKGRPDTAGRSLRLQLWSAVMLAGASIVLGFACSRYGAAIGGDGVAYVVAARNLLAGNGLSWIGAAGDVRPMTIFGPLFPVLLGALGLVGIEAQAAARGLNAVLFGANTLLVFVILHENIKARWAPMLGGLLFVFFPPVLGLHAGVQSEPLFLTLLLLETLALTRSLRGGSVGWLLVAGAAAGLGYLARFAGLAFVVSGMLALSAQQGPGWRSRIRQVGLFTIVAAVPIAAWMARNAVVGGSATDRLLVFEPLTLLLPILVADLVTYWFLPDRLPVLARSVAVLVGGGVLAGAWLHTRRAWRGSAGEDGDASRGAALLSVAVWGVVVYAGQVVLSRAILLPRISLDQRILAPVWLLMTLLLLTAAGQVVRFAGKTLAALAAVWLFLWTGSYIMRGTIRALELQVDGVGFASRAWQTSPLINAMSLLPADTPIYTNEVEALYLLAGRRVFRLPSGCLPLDALVVFEPGTECRTPEYLAWVANMDRALEQDRAVLAVFNTYRDFPYYAPLVPELVEGLDILTTQGDGRLYVYDREDWPDDPNW